ncbi:MAG TPA: glycosyltransferase [Gaiellaceae bacterium]|nr:glycosyltransferase [Gaiellaceae bacterium]
MRSLRILVVLSKLSPRYGGPPRRTVDFCAALAARGHTVELFTTDIDGPDRLDVPLGTPVERDGFLVTYHDARPLHEYAFSLGIASALRRRVGEFDVVHLKGVYEFPIVAGAFFCRRRRVPYVVEPSGVFDRYHRAASSRKKALHDLLLGRRVLGEAAAVRYASHAEQQQAIETGLDQGRGCIIPPGMVFPDERELVDVERIPGLVSYVGRVSAKKGLDVLLDAFALVAEQRPQCRLALAGNDDEGLTPELERRARELGIRSAVEFHGAIDGIAKFRLLAASEAFVLPTEAESFGAAAYEAMAVGTPTIVTPGLADHAALEAAGAAVVAERNAQAVAEALAGILDDPERSRAIAAAGKRHARSSYSREHTAVALEQLYAGLVQCRDDRDVSVTSASAAGLP